MRQAVRAGVNRPGPTPDGDGGTVTAELALGMIGLAIVLAAALNVVQIGLVKLTTTDAATAAARALARGEDLEVAESRARHLAGQDCEVELGASADLATATVTRQVALTLPGGGRISVVSRATSWTETGDGS